MSAAVHPPSSPIMPGTAVERVPSLHHDTLSPSSPLRGKAAEGPGTGRKALPTPEVHLNGRPESSLLAPALSPSSSGKGPNDGWGSHFWVTLVDPQTQVSFYACPSTGEVSWDPPVGNFLLPPSPEGEWWEMYDEQSGLPYYYHTKTGETVWDRPEAFVIPLGILQNTALARRLSITNRNRPKHTSATSGRRPFRQSLSSTAEQDVALQDPSGGSSPQSRRSQSSVRSSPGKSPTSSPASSSKRPASSRKSTSSGEHLHHSSGSQGGPLAYERGHSLAPIPGSPYATDVSSMERNSVSTNGRRAEEGKERDSPRKSTAEDPTFGRVRSKSSSYMSYRAPQPQSLTAALEMIALSSSQSSAGSDKRKEGASESVPAQPLSAQEYQRVRISTDPGMLRPSDLQLNTSLTPPNSPLRMKGKSKDKTSVPPSPYRTTSAAPKSSGSDVEPAPVFVNGKVISSPVFNSEATQNLSPMATRGGGTPIRVDVHQKLYARSINTGKYPVLPQDLAEDIQQFAESEFARQYFSTHRTGFFFKRTVPVAQIMTWQKTPLTTPLLMVNRSLQKDALKVFKVIQRIMGELNPLNSSTSSLHVGPVGAILEEERWLLGLGLTHGELRDEIYCQVMKQLNGNPNPESMFKGWQLMCVLLVTFPPSKNFETYLRSYFQQATNQQEGRVDVMAKHCLRRLAHIAKKGPRGKPPGIAEIETASDAAFHPSIFGESLDAIFRLQERNYPHKQVPIILPFLSDGILALGGTKSEGIFRVPGDGDAVSELKLRIDKGYYSLEGVDEPHVLASLLKLWLRELCDPLVPDEMYNDCITNARDPDACVQIVQRLPTINRRVVLFVISFLQLFLEEKVQVITKMTSPNLALVMAPNLLRCNSDSMAVVFTNAQYEQTFVHNLLLHLQCDEVDPDFIPTHGQGAIAPAIPQSRASKSRSRRPNF
ncbi:Rho GTPase-activating protein 39 [Grifola frondosa]|uniref:Rho GTPase-activating protein 39 n=1 Tax=Grifola frondosa TaxID=5627 RepID=A0A1C7LPE1_GRIFR|nr:Rho GTPase-activating protein 39 [Grifola frondosa]